MSELEKAFLLLPSLIEGDKWVRVDQIYSFHKRPGTCWLEVRLLNGEVANADLTAEQLLHKLDTIWRLVDEQR